jgi:hypothetical protein
MPRYRTYLLAALLITSPSAFAKGPFGPIQIGAWQGGAYTNDANGAFPHCAAGSQYQSGIFFVVGVDSAWGWSLGFHHDSWVLKEGETIPIELTFDNHSTFHVFGTAIKVTGEKVDFVKVPMPPDSQLINHFRRAFTMNAFAKGTLFGFNLTTTSQLLPALANCVKANLTNTASGMPNAETPTASSPDLQLEAIQLATNFILKSQLQNPKVLSRSETPVEFASFGAAWKSDEAAGAVKIIAPDSNLKGIDVAAAIAGGDAKECKGKFASGRVSELIDSEVIFRGFSSCEDTDGSRSAQFFVVPRKQGGFVIFLVASNMSEPSHNVIEGDNLVGFQKAALSASQ